MLFNIWFGSSLCYLFLLPFSWVYGFFSTLNRISYKYGWRKVYRFSVPIIVIGNLTIGGNGKTPMVLWLIDQLKTRGWRVGVVSRGYGGRSDKYPIIINSTSCSKKCGDEPLLIWRRTGVLVSVSPNRVKAVSALLKKQPLLDIIISDDGLQHYALFRDIEWVVIHSLRRFGNGCWLPAGPMRERITRLNTVQAIIINGLSNDIRSGAILMQLCPRSIINLVTGEIRPIQPLKDVVAIAGIGYPKQFFMTLQDYGIFPIKTIEFSDHHMYSEIMLSSLTSGNEMLLMTEKDAIKCLDFAHENWWYVHIDVNIHQEDTEKLLSKIESTIQYYKNN